MRRKKDQTQGWGDLSYRDQEAIKKTFGEEFVTRELIPLASKIQDDFGISLEDLLDERFGNFPKHPGIQPGDVWFGIQNAIIKENEGKEDGNGRNRQSLLGGIKDSIEDWLNRQAHQKGEKYWPDNSNTHDLRRLTEERTAIQGNILRVRGRMRGLMAEGERERATSEQRRTKWLQNRKTQ